MLHSRASVSCVSFSGSFVKPEKGTKGTKQKVNERHIVWLKILCLFEAILDNGPEPFNALIHRIL